MGGGGGVLATIGVLVAVGDDVAGPGWFVGWVDGWMGG